MRYFLDLFSPATYEAFSASDRRVSGFRYRQRNQASNIEIGDKLLCYMTRLSRWVGVLNVTSRAYHDNTPIFYEMDDPFTVRFNVEPEIWLPKEKSVPIHTDELWKALSFTKDHDKNSPYWTGKLRVSLGQIDDSDAKVIMRVLQKQANGGTIFPVNESEYQKLIARPVRTTRTTVAVTVPEDEAEPSTESAKSNPSQGHASKEIQGLLAKIGESMGMSIWIPRNDRGAVAQHWQPQESKTLLDSLPLTYDETTIRTIENIDIIWLRRRSIVRAFEVEHTTAIYSGLLRMADLMALQPNMDIKLHIVAPVDRREKVFSEIQRPVFSLLESGPLASKCTYIAYDSVEKIANEPHLGHMADSLLDDYAEEAEI